MGKRSQRNKVTLSSKHENERGYNIEPIFKHPKKEWDPLNNPAFNRRDQSYIRKIKPQNANQSALLEAMAQHNMVVAVGPAGTGKTYLAITAAVEALEAGKVDRIILSRPAIEAGETIGFLPGDLQEKMAPYLRPLYDALNDRLGGKRLKELMMDGAIEIAPIGYMRGRTLNIRTNQNAAHTPGLALHHGADWRPGPDRPAGRHVRTRRYRAAAGDRERHRRHPHDRP